MQIKVSGFLRYNARDNEKRTAAIGKAKNATIDLKYVTHFDASIFGNKVREIRIPIISPPILTKLSLNGNNPIITVITKPIIDTMSQGRKDHVSFQIYLTNEYSMRAKFPPFPPHDV